MSEAQEVLHVSKGTKRSVAAYAKEVECTLAEAADALIMTAVGRRKALAAYAKKQKRGKK